VSVENPRIIIWKDLTVLCVAFVVAVLWGYTVGALAPPLAGFGGDGCSPTRVGNVAAHCDDPRSRPDTRLVWSGHRGRTMVSPQCRSTGILAAGVI
jgi:hypothetical protein